MRNSRSFQRSGADALVKSLAIVSLAALAAIAFAESPRRVPGELADQIEAVVEENVLRTFKVLQEGKQDLPAFERGISKMLVYIRQGSAFKRAYNRFWRISGAARKLATAAVVPYDFQSSVLEPEPTIVKTVGLWFSRNAL